MRADVEGSDIWDIASCRTGTRWTAAEVHPAQVEHKTGDYHCVEPENSSMSEHIKQSRAKIGYLRVADGVVPNINHKWRVLWNKSQVEKSL